MLSHINNTDLDYDVWIKIGMALHHSSAGSAYDLWEAWSSTSSKHDPADMAKKWHSFGKSTNPVTIGTLVHYAEEGGWKWPVTFNPEPFTENVKAEGVNTNDHKAKVWGKPKPLPDGLHPVLTLDVTCLPSTIRTWVADIADRMQCPIDFVAIPAVIALGTVLGAKIGIKPEEHTDWIEVPNLWGIIVGRPGTMKSPAVSEVLQPLQMLQKKANSKNQKALEEFEVAKKVHATKRKILDKDLEDALESGKNSDTIEQKLSLKRGGIFYRT